MNAMHYKNYVAKIEYSEDDDCFIGHMTGIDDVIGFHSHSVAELHEAFKEAVDDYLEACKKIGRKPQKPYSRKIMLRIPPEIHARAAMVAKAHGKSLNAWVTQLLSEAG